ncbi:hypothetical protein ACMSIO_01315 [Pseudomonas benzopyrenica]|uniref:hypothetical protein n=1 Tax=Pseudomonas benzopyrenica TaxID=2993566 RepID=UPI0039C21605
MRTKTLALLAAALAGCTSQANLERNPPMELRTGKSADDYRACLVAKLERGGRHVEVQSQGSGQRVLVDSKVPPATAAVIDISSASRGTRIALREQMANNPLRPQDVLLAVKDCL